jgi:hypothetical protein
MGGILQGKVGKKEYARQRREQWVDDSGLALEPYDYADERGPPGGRAIVA